MTARRARRVLMRGRVQGVGFRWSTCRAARQLDLAGWVRNLEDGSVEVHVEGEADAVLALESWLAEGPEHARVDEVEARDVEAAGGDGFEARL